MAERFGLLFPGQGAQTVGMGRDLFKEDLRVRKLFQQAADITGRDIAKYAFKGPFAMLSRTDILQPAITAVNLACFILFSDSDIKPVCAAGHSLGKISALAAAGSISFQTAIQLAARRGEFMHEASKIHPGGMAAVTGLTQEQLDALIAAHSPDRNTTIANFNSPEQIVISGPLSDLAKLKHPIQAQNARFRRLDVSGAWHSPAMIPAREKLKPLLEKIPFNRPAFPVIHNYSVRSEPDANAIRGALAAQITQPVRWTETIRAMQHLGVNVFIEIGPGSILSRLLRKIIPDISTYRTVSLNSMRSIRRFLDSAI